VQRIRTIEVLLEEAFGLEPEEGIDPEEFTDLLQRKATEHLSFLTELDIEMLQPDTLLSTLESDLAAHNELMETYLLEVVAELKSMMKDRVSAEIYSYIWEFPDYDAWFDVEFFGFSDPLDVYAVVTKPFLMVQFDGGILMVENIMNLADPPSMTLHYGDTVTVAGQYGVVSDGPEGDIPSYWISFTEGEQLYQVFDIETSTDIPDDSDRWVYDSTIPDIPPIPRPSLVPGTTYAIDLGGYEYYSHPIWYAEHPGGRVYFWKPSGTIIMLPSSSASEFIYDTPQYTQSDTPKDKIFKVDTPVIGIATVALVGAILWIEL
jgi:hypothetical protein